MASFLKVLSWSRRLVLWTVIFSVGLGVTFKIPVRAASVIIQNDAGGRIGDYLPSVELLRRSGTKVAFVGYCGSACTLYLSLPSEQLCVTKSAKFLFHRAGPLVELSAADAKVVSGAGTRILLKMYPNWVHTWLKSQGGFLTENHMIMPNSYARQFIQPCR